MNFTCCICHEAVNLGEPDTYTIQVSQPELLWAHRKCLFKTIPVICEQLPQT